MIGITLLLLASAGAVGGYVFVWPVVFPEHFDKAPAAASREPPAPQASLGAPASSVKAATEALKALGPQTEPKDRTPAFDIARIEPDGAAAIAGRAAPGASVELLRGSDVHDKVVANPTGEFVFVPKPLPPGNYALTLRATDSGGRTQTSKDSVAVDLKAGSQSKPVVALVAPDKPAVVLSKPAADPAPAPAKPTIEAAVAPSKPIATDAAPAGVVAIDSVESETGGKLYVSGRSAPGASVRLYLNDSYIASATASTEGRVAFSIQSGVRPGVYRVRLDQVETSGNVRSRAEVAFTAPPSVAVAAAPPPVPLPPVKPSDPAVVAAQTPPPVPVPAPGMVASGSTPPPPVASVAAENKSPPAPAPAYQVASAPPAPATTSAPASSPAPQTSEVSTSAAPPASPPGDRKDFVVVPRIDTTVVARGDSLWRISQSTYGNGVRYSVIYAANKNQIRDPDLIYPGQIFVLPKKD